MGGSVLGGIIVSEQSEKNNHTVGRGGASKCNSLILRFKRVG
jgi:hypothetical protein